MNEKDIVLSYETLFELLRIERSRTELQQLPDNFFSEVKAMLDSDRHALENLTDEADKKKKISNINSIVKISREIYERRERKIINSALDKSKTKAAIVDISKFLETEKEIFNSVLELLNEHRNNLNKTIFEVDKSKQEDKEIMAEAKAGNAEEKGDPSEEAAPNPLLQLVRFLYPMPSFLGEKLEEYGPFDEEDVANLPKKITDVLIKKKRVEKISNLYS